MSDGDAAASDLVAQFGDERPDHAYPKGSYRGVWRGSASVAMARVVEGRPVEDQNRRDGPWWSWVLMREEAAQHVAEASGRIVPRP
jgi:hypothetical protein